jgi:hypothetical protein
MLTASCRLSYAFQSNAISLPRTVAPRTAAASSALGYWLVLEGSFILAPPSVGSIGDHTMDKVAGIVRAASVLHIHAGLHSMRRFYGAQPRSPTRRATPSLVCRDAARSHTKASSHSFVVSNGLPIVVASFSFIGRPK